MTYMRSNHSELIVCLFLVVATLAVFWQVQNHDFVYDDTAYITENCHVRAGLTLKGITWAFTTLHAGFWIPLTWLSHMFDCHLYWLNPNGHHFNNLLLHIANTLLLFLVLKRMTGALWKSSLVAALFALHPLHVESVAWVSSRKDVLSTLFWMLTMLAYVRYVEQPGLNRYLLVLLFLALGLMSKPMLVTLPFVLLLLDYWPLGRLQLGQSVNDYSSQTSKLLNTGYQRPPAIGLVCEKVPFLALSAVSSFLAFFAEKHFGALPSLESCPLNIRLANALVSYVRYILKMIWPHHLAVFYPHPINTLPMWQVTGACLLLVCISFLIIRLTRRKPYLAVGWLWYLGTLVPAIGLVQVGSHAMADRYTYVPLIGLFMIIAWAVPDITAKWRNPRIALAISAGVLLSALIISSWIQVKYWRNNIMLFGHALDVTSNNYVAHHNLGVALYHQGNFEEAIAHYSEALRIIPGYADAHYNLGNALAMQGKLKEALAHYSEALRIKPDFIEAQHNLKVTLHRMGKHKEVSKPITIP